MKLLEKLKTIEEPKEGGLSTLEMRKFVGDIEQGIQKLLEYHKNDVRRLSEDESRNLTEAVKNFSLDLQSISRVAEKTEVIKAKALTLQEQLRDSKENKGEKAAADSLFLQNLEHSLIAKIQEKVGEIPKDTKSIITAAVSKIEDGRKQIIELFKLRNIKLIGPALTLISAGIGVLMGIFFLLKSDQKKLTPDEMDEIARQTKNKIIQPIMIDQGWGRAPGVPHRAYYLYGKKDVQSLVIDVLYLVESKKPEDLSKLEYRKIQQVRDILWNPGVKLDVPDGTIDKLFGVMSQYHIKPKP